MMSFTNYRETMENLMRDKRGKLFSALLDYSDNPTICCFRHSHRGHIDYTWRTKNRHTFWSSEVYNDCNYVFFRDSDDQMEDQEIVRHTEALDEKLNTRNHRLWAMPTECKKSLLCEDNVRALLTIVVVIPVLCILRNKLALPVPLHLDAVEEFNVAVKLFNKTYNIRSDLAIRQQKDVLVVMEVKFPSIGHSLSERDHHCTDMVSQIFYQCVGAATPYAVLGDSEYVLFMEICKVALDNKKNFEFKVKPSDNPRPEDAGIPVAMKFRRVHKRDHKITIQLMFAVFVANAFDTLIVQGRKEEYRQYILQLADKLKLTKYQKQVRLEKDSAFLKRETKNVVEGLRKEIEGLVMSTLVLKAEDCKSVCVTSKEGYRNAQVYRIEPQIKRGSKRRRGMGEIIKIFDPRKAPPEEHGDVIPYTLNKEIAFESFRTELRIYNLIKKNRKPGSLSVTPELVSQGYAMLGGKDATYGPFIRLENVGGEEPDMENPDHVRLILDSYKELLRSGVVHGDLKKENIRLAVRDGKQMAIIFDFGFSSVGKVIKKKILRRNRFLTSKKIVDGEILLGMWRRAGKMISFECELSREEQLVVDKEFGGMFKECYPGLE